MAAPGRAEMVLLREALEGVVTPEVATALLFAALERAGGAPPGSLEEARGFARGALAETMRERVPEGDASRILQRIEERLAHPRGPESIDVDVDPDAWGEEDPTATKQMLVVRKPVPVVVISAGGSFAERLVMCLGEDRVRAVATGDEASLRKAVFAYSPLIVLVDGVGPTSMDAGALTAALHDVPDSAMPVLWGSETGWSRSILPRFEGAGVRLVTLDRREGIEPLLDLVLARFRGD